MIVPMTAGAGCAACSRATRCPSPFRWSPSAPWHKRVCPRLTGGCVIAGLFVGGLGMGMVFPVATTPAIESVPHRRAGMAAGAFTPSNSSATPSVSPSSPA
ncbi:hypothetical protein [Streptomyces sp. NPDC001604]|uniref:hypothetical protein n=1 Tax=Streptomyces sp. NPDC001604 TaxID=3364593 RepID=UPI003696E6B0